MRDKTLPASMTASISKLDAQEDVWSPYQSYLNDFERRRAGRDSGAAPPAISDERIEKGTDLIGTYTVESDEITGGMGSVWKVHHKEWGIDLAMKRPRRAFFEEAGPGRKKAFVEECSQWLRLGLHPNIVSCYYVREISGVPTIFSEWMEGGSLADQIRSGELYRGSEKEQQERILAIALGSMYGLCYAHNNDLVHQDIKPSNLLLTGEGLVKISDFGLARARKKLGFGRESTEVAGYSPAYCPPEQIRGGQAEPWMDVYAWALTTIEMYAKGRTWETGAGAGASAKAIETLIDSCALPVPRQVRDVLTRCLTFRFRRSDRFYDRVYVIEPLRACYQEIYGKRYPEPPLQKLTDTADSLNNRALSCQDLGMDREAKRLWELALQAEAFHQDSLFNRELYAVRSGEKYDFEAMQALDCYPSFREQALSSVIARGCGGVYEDSPEASAAAGPAGAVYTVSGGAEAVAAADGYLYLALYEDPDSRSLKELSCVRQDTGREVKRDALTAVHSRSRELRQEDDTMQQQDSSRQEEDIRILSLYPKKDLAVIRIETEICLYDIKHKTIRGRLAWAGHPALTRACFSPDGFLIAVYEIYDSAVSTAPPRCVILRAPSLKPVMKEKMRFLCFAGTDCCLLSTAYPERIEDRKQDSNEFRTRARNKEDYGALYFWNYIAQKQKSSARSGGLREVFRFDMCLEEERILTGPDFILFCKTTTLDYYALDRSWQKIPVTKEMFYRMDRVFRYDPKDGLVYAACRGGRIAVWDLKDSSCLCTIPGPGSDTWLWNEAGDGFIAFDRSPSGGSVRWRSRPFYARDRQDIQKIPYRVSHVLTADSRLEDDRRMQALLEDFKSAFQDPFDPADDRKFPELDKALDCYEQLGEIEGYVLSPQLEEMEELLEYYAVRSGIRTGALKQVVRERPEAAGRYTGIERDPDGAGTCFDDRSRKVVFFGSDGRPGHTVRVSEDISFAPVRNNRIYAFTDTLGYLTFTWEGKPYGFGMFLQEFMNATLPGLQCTLADMDSDGSHVLVDVKTDKKMGNPAGLPAGGSLQFGLQDYSLLRLSEGKGSCSCYLQGDTIITVGNGLLFKTDHETGSLLQVSAEPPEETVRSITPSQERDRFFVEISGKLLLYDEDLRLLGSCSYQGGGFQVLPGGCFIQTGPEIWNVEQGKLTWKCSPFQDGAEAFSGDCDITIRPDGKELYCEIPGTERGSDQRDIYVYRLIYEYAPDPEKMARILAGTEDEKKESAGRPSSFFAGSPAGAIKKMLANRQIRNMRSRNRDRDRALQLL